MSAGTTKRIVGGRGKRRDADSIPVVTNWQTDVITDRDPDYVYQFFRADEVRDKLRASRIQLNDFAEGTSEVHTIPAWEVCHAGTGLESLPGFRPDEGKPADSVLMHGGMVCLKLHRDHWALLQRTHEQRADAYEQKLRGGAAQEFGFDGHETGVTDGAHVAPGNIRQVQKPLARI